MALEQFRTQVLLLHSQQSTLDALSAGFNDRYSVHFATTGSEALSTLGETPIHVIISAQDLPGMSGLEALREAKKRSPDTIGILLAGDNADDGVEALVGDKEVFQVVRGQVEPQALRKIVENATRRVRMLTLSHSANDNAANVDMPATANDDENEHIVMETADNGASIISDGTGRMPALKPEKIQAAPDVGGRNVDVLVLTRDSEFLDTIRSSSRGLHNVHHTTTGPQAQEIVAKHPVGVIVTDAAIAGDKVELLIRKLRITEPRLVAIVAGRRDDGEMLMELINRGQVYRFLLKPVSPGRARLAVEASVKHHLEGPDTAFQGAPPSGSIATVSKPQPAAKPAPARPAAAPQRQSRATPAKPVMRAVPAGGDAALADTRRMKQTSPGMKTTIRRARQTQTLQAQPQSGLNPRSKSLLLAAAASVVVVAGGLWFFMPGDEVPAVPGTAADAARDGNTAVPATPAAATEAAAAATPAAAASEYVALLDNARFARDSGRLLAPAGDNAIEWYVAAREAAPDNAVIAGELDALVQRVIGIAETALLENRTADAANALAMVALASPDNARLGFLNAQLEQQQLRTLLDDARAAIREARFEDAGSLLARAADLAGDDRSQVEQLTADLAAARSAQRIEDVLAEANTRLADGRLITPSNDNARYFFELALSNDPGNQAARQGLLVVASKLVLKARDAIDAGDLQAAGEYLSTARELDPASADLQASESALTAALERQQEIERQAAAEREAAEQRAAAAEERRRAAASATLRNAPAEDAATTAPDDATAADGAGSPATANGAAEPSAEAAAADAVAAAPALQAPKAVAVSELRRVNYVAPEYPRGAQRRDLSGWVEIGFTVTESGETVALEVIDSVPGTIFNDAAIDAVSQWRFEPVIENGTAIPVRVAVRMSFSLE